MFQFKQFTIHQDRTPMKVGTDGVLLGAWADVRQAHRILDIGTGTGLIALMAAQRNQSAIIDALEIEPEAFKQAQENIKAAPWFDRISIFEQALQSYTSNYQYDCILCNPPFFHKSTKAPDQGRTLARHNDSLPLCDLLTHTVRLLHPQGIFCVILPTTEAQKLVKLGKDHKLFLQHITQVHPTPNKPPKRYLLQLGFQEKPLIEDHLILEFERHKYSPEYSRLTTPFYLNK